MKRAISLSEWLKEKCKKERLSLREAAAKTGLSHATIGDIINGSHPLPETIKKLARGFGGNGKRGLALEDKLLILAGYRTQRPDEEDEEGYLKIIPLLSPGYQHIIEVLVMEFAKIEGIPTVHEGTPSED